MTNGIRVDLDDFAKLGTTDDKLEAIFKNTSHLIEQNESCQDRILALEKSKKKSLGLSAGSGGFVGGLIVAVKYLMGG